MSSHLFVVSSWFHPVCLWFHLVFLWFHRRVCGFIACVCGFIMFCFLVSSALLWYNRLWFCFHHGFFWFYPRSLWLHRVFVVLSWFVWCHRQFCGFIMVSSWFHRRVLTRSRWSWVCPANLALLGAKASGQRFLVQLSSCVQTTLPPQQVSGVASKAFGNEPAQRLLRHRALHTHRPQGFFKTPPKRL